MAKAPTMSPYRNVPKEARYQLAWREKWSGPLKPREIDMAARACAASAEGFLFWLNTFGWTYNPRIEPSAVPFNTWPVQDAAARTLWTCIDRGEDVLLDKSRDMGASWLCLEMMLWWWLFCPSTPLLIASRKEDYVDSRGDPDTLFWKLDYQLARLPGWMRPAVDRTSMHLGNRGNGSTIDGESTNRDIGRGGRRKAILLDEFAAVENGREILAATADATPCRVFNSTPQGRGNAFADVRFSNKVRVITLPWWEHPEKGKGRREIDDGGKLRWTSPWYEAECGRRTSRKEIAQELDIDYLASVTRSLTWTFASVCGRAWCGRRDTWAKSSSRRKRRRRGRYIGCMMLEST